MGRSFRRGVPALALLAVLVLAPAAGAALAPGALDPSFGSGGVAGATGLFAATPAGGGVDGQGRIVTIGGYVDATFLQILPHIPFVNRILGDGSADPGFAGGGLLTLGQDPAGFGGTGPEAGALAPGDATLVAATAAGRVFVNRITAAGGIDPAFGTDGRADVGDSGGGVVFGVAAVPAGVLVGWTPAGGHPRLTRLTSAGTVDTAYGDDGTAVLTALADGGRLAVAADGSAFAAGPSGSAPAVVALDAAGAPRAGFGAAGVAKGPKRVLGDGRVSALALAPGGGLYLVADGLVSRVTAAGAFDAAFAPRLELSAVRASVPTALVVQPDGDVLVAAAADPPAYVPPVAPPVHRPGVPYATSSSIPPLPEDGGAIVARLTPAGAFDCSYGNGGHARLLPPPATVDALALDAADRLVTFGARLPGLPQDADVQITRSGAGVGVVPAHPAVPVAMTSALADPAGYGPLPAKATGWVDPRCTNVTAHFEYGRTTAYGSRTKDIAVAGAGGPRTVSAVLPPTAVGAYHYRLVVSGPGGRVAGHDASFSIRVDGRSPRLVLALSRANVHNGRVPVLLRCRYAACDAVLTLRRRGTVLGTGDAALGAGERARVPIRLNAAGRSRVAHHRVSAMVLTIATANAATATAPITVRAPR